MLHLAPGQFMVDVRQNAEPSDAMLQAIRMQLSACINYNYSSSTSLKVWRDLEAA